MEIYDGKERELPSYCVLLFKYDSLGFGFKGIFYVFLSNSALMNG